jgi:hypothetical protein
LPELNTVAQKFASEGLVVIGAGTGEEPRLEAVREKTGVTFPMPHATDALLESLGLTAFPETVMIDRLGRVAAVLHGGQDAAYFEARVKELLAEPWQEPAVEALGGTTGGQGAASSTALPQATGGEDKTAPTRDSGEGRVQGKHGLISRLVYRWLAR